MRKRLVVTAAVLVALVVVLLVAYLKQGVTIAVDQPGPTVESASLDTGGQALTVRYSGGATPATAPCGEDYEVRVDERGDAVVVTVRVTAEYLSFGIGSCSGVGQYHDTTVVLGQPLRGRPVVDGKDQHVVPVPAATG